jgi:hypothetical protein
MYGSNKHLAGFLKPILNKVFFPNMILVGIVNMTGQLSTNGSTGSSPSLIVKNSKANVGERCWWATNVAVPFEPGLDTEEARRVALAAWHGHRAARGMASISCAFTISDRPLLLPSFLHTTSGRDID